MYYLFIATCPTKRTQYAITDDSGWYSWHSDINILLTKSTYKELPNDTNSHTEFYTDACNNNPEYTINYFPIGNKLDDLQTTHPELFI